MPRYTCVLTPGWERWRPDPFPGSDDARLQGCSCPDDQPWPGKLVFDSECSVHQLTKLKPS